MRRSSDMLCILISSIIQLHSKHLFSEPSKAFVLFAAIELYACGAPLLLHV